MTIGSRIKRLRIEKGYSQEKLGAIIGVQKQAIYKYEQGLVVNLKRSSIAKLAKALEVSPSHLMGFDEDVSNEDYLDKAFDCLNIEGQQLVLDYIDTLIQSGKYDK